MPHGQIFRAKRNTLFYLRPVPKRYSEPPPKKGRYHHGALRQALLDAVGEILRTDGQQALSLRYAARRARVSHSAPAHHFRNKAGLLTAFAIEGFERLAATVEQARLRRPPRTGIEVLETMGSAYVEFAFTHPHHFEMMYRTDLLNLKDPDYQRANRASFGMLWKAVDRCVQEGLLPRRNAEEAATALWSLAYGLVMLKFSGRLGDNLPNMRKPEFVQRAIRFVVRRVMSPMAKKKSVPRPLRKRAA